jgi:hypothetical protein
MKVGPVSVVCIKELLNTGSPESGEDAFKKEIDILAKVNHP